jgi:AAA+ superfamily predicted ATPase
MYNFAGDASDFSCIETSAAIDFISSIGIMESMGLNDNVISGLREALRVSPNNLPLRQMLADCLLGAGDYVQAESEYKTALALSPENRNLKTGLAQAFQRQQKNSLALVIVEDLLKGSEPAANLLVLHAQLLLAMGNRALAASQYRHALELDPEAEAADPRLSSQLDKSVAMPPPATSPKRTSSPKRRTPPLAVEDKLDEAVPVVTFADVGGMEAVKDDIRIKIIHPLTHPELYKAYGKTTGGGILMYGPPGCGKTHLARATAGEINASFISVGISDVLDMWIGSSERNLHAIFEQARRRRPCVLFFDEVDALAASRSDMRASAGRHMINQFLAEMDGVNSDNEGVLMLAATNAPWHVDPAFRRPGRFDSILFVPPPDEAARATILEIRLKGKPVGKINADEIAALTAGFSGADLKGVVDLAVEGKLRAALKTGHAAPLETEDLAQAVQLIKPSTVEWFAAARNYAMYANQGGTYDDVLKHLKM